MPDIMRQLAVNLSLSAFRCILQHSLAIIFRLVNNNVTRNEGNQLGVQAFGKLLQQLLLVRCITAIADDASQTHTAAHSKTLNTLSDVVGSVQAHQLAGRNNIYIGCIALANWHGKTAANYVT